MIKDMLEVEEVRGLLERLYIMYIDGDEGMVHQDREELLDEIEDYLGIEHGERE